MARELCEEKSREIGSSGGFCYSDISSSSPIIHQNHMVNQIRGFEGNPAEIFNLTTGMEMIGFSKNLQQQQAAAAADSNSVVWKGFFKGDNPGPSSSKTMNESTTSDHCYQHHEFNKQDFSTGMSESSGDRNLLVGPDHHHHHHHHHHDMTFISSSSSRDEFFGKPAASSSIQQMIQDGFLGKATANIHHHQPGQLQLRDSDYLGPAQELLNEFCSLGTKRTDATKHKHYHKAKQQWDDKNASGSSRNIKQSLSYLEFMELQKRKTDLLQMLAELDRRYKLYCDQMKVVVSSFEAVAGTGAARVYSALASEAISRHFRCLRDGIVGHIQATNKAMGEKDPMAPGTSRGETPRLKMIDQALRQQRAFHQTSMTETHPWRPQRGLPERSVSLLRAWLFEHFLHPYPSDVDKHVLARQTGLSRSQVSNWFINARVRLWKPMVEEMYLDETKEHDNNAASNSDGVAELDDSTVPVRPHVQHQHHQMQQDLPAPADRKPTQDQLVRIDSECMSSIISTSADKYDHVNKATPKANINSKALQNHHQRRQDFGSFGNAMQLDFSSYNQQQTVGGGGVSYANDQNAHHQNFHGDGGVSLTLGLQQHGGSGVSLAFSPASESSLFYPTRSDQDCQQVQYSLSDGDQGQHLPYRNLMGAQLRHDLAGWFIN